MTRDKKARVRSIHDVAEDLKQLNDEKTRFDETVKELFDGFLKRHPTVATFFGIHKYDHLLPDGRPEAAYEDIRLAKDFQERFREIAEDKLDFSRKLDLHLVNDLLRLWLFDTEQWPLWKMFPEASDTVGESLFPLFVRDFAPLPSRLESIRSRLERAPKYIDETKKRLEDPVEIYCQVALESAQRLPMFLGLISKTGSEALGDTAEGLLKATEGAEHSLEDYQAWLREEIKVSRKDFHIGDERFARRLRLRGIDLEVAQILSLGERYLSQEKENLRRYANRIQKGATIEQVKDRIRSEHPANYESALATYKDAVVKARRFVQESGFATIPEGEDITVVETPSFLTHVIPFAAYMSPAKFDEQQTGVYLVTPTESPEMLEEHNYYSISNTSVHEAYPGHHLQLAASNQNPSLVRLLSQGTEFVEGWAHYCEEAVKDLGYDDTPEHRFVQTQGLIWRAVRIIVDIKLSTGLMAFDEAVDLLVKETGMAREAALAEVKRYTFTPGYQLSYLLGKHMIKELREETKQRLGDSFGLKAFHDALIYAGSIPIKYQRTALREILKPA